MDTPRVEPMSRTLAARTKKRYVCAGCWSELMVVPHKDNPQLDNVLCPNCECPGYISKKSVERKTQSSYADALEARHNLKAAVPFLNPNAGKQVSELLAELGF
jgi:DNA-directed RNA polymerase subunit RPC12/RpoP